PKEGEALVRIEAAGVNFIDVYHRTGQYKSPVPFTVGMEGAGTVEAVGPGVQGLSSGDRVGSVNFAGSYAQYATARAERLVPIPEGVTIRQAAAALLQGMTAHYLTHATYPLRAGDVCLVHAGAGGVGLLLCQMGRRIGARVIATAGGPEKERLARDAGAEETIDYRAKNFSDEVRRITGGKGVRVVYDSVGKDTFQGSLDSLGVRGTLALFGQSSGAVPPVDPQILNQKGSLFLTRPTLAHYVALPEELAERSADVLRAIAAGQLSIRIFREIPLAEAAESHRLLEGRKTTGKLLLIP
ncbi:MAG: quinone oxidoreductase, partial [Acidobacteria bacterium]|nr:quinone oxidoreductase [Acidobacteriota bacterium]MCA1610383.1 quinone oxidoreductase [Acidobacteriota bacterium]